MVENISEERIKEILKNYDRMLATINLKIKNLYENLIPESEKDVIIRDIAIPAVSMGAITGTHEHKDLSDILIKMQRIEYERNTEIRSIMWSLSEEKEEIYRVWGCFQALSSPHYMILRRLYVEHELYHTVELESEMSHMKFECTRRDGILMIKQYYESNRPIAEIMRMARKCKKEVRHTKKKSSQDQLTIDDLLRSTGKA